MHRARLLPLTLLFACSNPPVAAVQRPSPPSEVRASIPAPPAPSEVRAPAPPSPIVAVAGSSPTAAVAVAPATCLQDRRILACRRGVFDSPPPTLLALGTRPGEIALAWVTLGDAAYFARYRPDLSPIDKPRLLAPRGVGDVALAALPTGGWMLAIGTGPAIEVWLLAPDGQPRGQVLRLPGTSDPQLFARPDGGPLLLWTQWSQGKSATFATLLDEAGGERFRVQLFSNLGEARSGNAVYTGDGFLVAERVSSTGRVGVVRVELDGRKGQLHVLPGVVTHYPLLSWSGSSARLTWCFFDDPLEIHWATLDRTGALAGAPVALASVPHAALSQAAYLNPSPPISVGEDTLVLLAGSGWTPGTASRLDFVRLDPRGNKLGAPWHLLPPDASAIGEYRAARVDDTIAIAWLEGATQVGRPAVRAGLARVALQ
jgi:hypothetical protein